MVRIVEITTLHKFYISFKIVKIVKYPYFIREDDNYQFDDGSGKNYDIILLDVIKCVI